jgi:hypothetical protein
MLRGSLPVYKLQEDAEKGIPGLGLRVRRPGLSRLFWKFPYSLFHFTILRSMTKMA